MSIDLLLSNEGLGETDSAASTRIERVMFVSVRRVKPEDAQLAEHERLEKLKKDATREEGFKRG
jgi:hypothetical protein